MSLPPVIVLHVGTMRSGAYVQSRLEHHRERLAADGVLFPGPRGRDQLRAVTDALDRARDSNDLSSGSGRWASMREQMLGWTGARVVLSVDQLTRASRTQARAIAASLGPAPVEVVITARDLGRDLPSNFQLEIEAGSAELFEQFLHAVGQPAEGGHTGGRDDQVTVLARRFWRRHDAASVVHRWAESVPAEHITVVTVPPAGAGPDVLWQRFAAAAGIDAGRYPPPAGDLAWDPSLGAAGVELVRQLNERLGDRLTRGAQRDLVQVTVANSTVGGPGDEPHLQIPQEHREWIADRAATIVTQLRSVGVRVVGDVNDLIPTASVADPAAAPEALSDPTEVSAHSMAAAAVRAAAALLRSAGAGGPGGPAGNDRGGRGGGKNRRRPTGADHESAVQPPAAGDAGAL